MEKTTQKYQYKIADSILGKMQDEYALSENEYYCIYSFFVTYSMCGSQSAKKRTFSDYGWSVENVKNTTLGSALENVLNLNRNLDFIFTDKDELAIQFNSKNLPDGPLIDIDKERAVISKTSDRKSTRLNSSH